MTPTGQMYQNGDIRQLHERINELDNKLDERLVDLGQDINEAAVAIGKLETRLELAPKPPARPCLELTNHLTDHRESKRLWQRPIVTAMIHLVELALIAVLTWAFVAGKSSPPGLPTAHAAEITQPRSSQGP